MEKVLITEGGGGGGAEVVWERGAYLRVEEVRVHHGALDVVQVGVVLQRPLQEACLLAQLGDVGAVVVGEHLVAEDGVGDLEGVGKGMGEKKMLLRPARWRIS